MGDFSSSGAEGFPSLIHWRAENVEGFWGKESDTGSCVKDRPVGESHELLRE